MTTMAPEEIKEIEALLEFLRTPNTISNLYESVIVRRELFEKMVEVIKEYNVWATQQPSKYQDH